MFDNLKTIMERMTAFLQQLRVFVDDPLKRAEAGLSVRETIFEVLKHFLTVLVVSPFPCVCRARLTCLRRRERTS